MRKSFGLAFVALALCLASLPLVAQDAKAKPKRRQELKIWADTHLPTGLVQARQVLELLAENDALRLACTNTEPKSCDGSTATP